MVRRVPCTVLNKVVMLQISDLIRQSLTVSEDSKHDSLGRVELCSRVLQCLEGVGS